MLVYVPIVKKKTYTKKYLARDHSKSSMSKQPTSLLPKTTTLHDANWHTVRIAGSGTWCTASLLTMSIPPEQKQ